MNYSALSAFADDEKSEPLEVEGVALRFTTWARKEDDGSLGVIAEVRRNRFLGWSQVRANGFFAHPDGRKIEMVEKDLWNHGY